MTLKVNTRTTTIANAATDSGVIELNGQTIVGLSMPAAFIGTSIKFLVDNGSNAFNVMADGAGADVDKTVAINKFIKLSPADFAGIDRLKLQSASQSSGAVEIIVHVREID